ncbi:chemotaxis-specific protein-glutamate methyltransferase CheB [Paracoccus aurantiacus]|uniref:Protein-glutamate methylesterase/protein-glutamine glutaminase n=1 Tax=Paracoccus aurantiacus TaxID=2599412 RepID=A0A5C6S8N7_9RHOB|nr:chemotaxis-specific protein-glutamate methyltransferase CheB [Paracoccus aurantiacus]TXB70748.1 chemotaxis-specific protein-glutamate methyltransferase CheB [Paracoccus aurantiacus]
MTPVRVLIIDDSATMRRLIQMRLRSDSRIEVVGEASNTFEAKAAIDILAPDVLTLDVEMPGQSGLDFLVEMMRKKPMPVIMISSETQRGSTAALEALSRGAVDCLGKPRVGDSVSAFADLPGLVIAASTARLLSGRPVPAVPAPAAMRRFEWSRKIVLIGASTGGVDALETIFARMPENCPPTLVTQHMPSGFLAKFAQRMNARYAPEIRLAENNAPLQQGTIQIAPGGDFHLCISTGLRQRCLLTASEKVHGHRPSVDVLFDSARPIADRIVAVLLTGMGQDGAQGMLNLRRAGAICLAQDEESSVVWGMPRTAWQNGGAERLVSLNAMAAELLAATELTMRRDRALP